MFLNIYPTLCQVRATSLAHKKRVGKANRIFRVKGKKLKERGKTRILRE